MPESTSRLSPNSQISTVHQFVTYAGLPAAEVDSQGKVRLQSYIGSIDPSTADKVFDRINGHA